MNKVILLLLLCFINNCCFAENPYFVFKNYLFNSNIYKHMINEGYVYSSNHPEYPSLGTPPYPTDPQPQGDIPQIIVTPPAEEILTNILF